jgi:hypothetical protein
VLKGTSNEVLLTELEGDDAETHVDEEEAN